MTYLVFSSPRQDFSMDRPFLLLAWPLLCKKQHSHHCLCVRASANHLVLVLFWPPVAGVYVSRQVLLEHANTSYVCCVIICFFFFSFLTVGLYYCFSNLSDARIFIIMYGVTSMYFSAVMVCPVIIWKDIFRQSICLPFWFLHILSLPLKKNYDKTDFVSYLGTSHASPGSSHVYPVRYWCVPSAHNLHEEFRCKPDGQEEQETTGFNLSHQKWGKNMRWPGKAGVFKIVACRTFKHEQHPQDLTLSSLLYPSLCKFIFLSVNSFYRLDEQSYAGTSPLCTGIFELTLRLLGIDWLSARLGLAPQPIRNLHSKLY